MCSLCENDKAEKIGAVIKKTDVGVNLLILGKEAIAVWYCPYCGKRLNTHRQDSSWDSITK